MMLLTSGERDMKNWNDQAEEKKVHENKHVYKVNSKLARKHWKCISFFFYFIGWTENSTPKILKVITWNRYIKNQSLWMSMDFGTLCLGWTITGLYHSNFVPNLKVANNIVFFFFILLFGNFCNSPETKKWVLK